MFQLIENHDDFTDTVIVGLQPNGIYLANRIQKELELITNQSVITGALDITFLEMILEERETSNSKRN